MARRPPADVLERCHFPTDGPLVCAVSGGADSAALVILAHATGRPTRAVHVDHGLRPDSQRDAEVVAVLAAELGVDLDVVAVEVPDGPNLEARARDARHRALPGGCLLGHTLDDQAETVLLQLLRGGGLDAVAAMRPDRRPLLGLRRADTERVCELHGYTPVDDATNRDPRFRRNRVRHEVLPLLNDVFARDVAPLLARTASVVSDERDLLDELASAIDPTDAAALTDAPAALARRAVRMWLSDPYPPDLATVERVRDVAAGRARATEAGRGRRVARSAGRLRLE